MVNIDELVNWCVNDRILHTNYFDNFALPCLVLQIQNNILYVIKAEYLSDGIMEERQFSICSMINYCLSKYNVDDCIFAYCTNDRCDFNFPFLFTHARLKGKNDLILAPCFTFHCYREYNNMVMYEDSYKTITNYADKIDWVDKDNKMAFVGSLTYENYRIQNTQLNEKIALDVLNQPASSESFVKREYLSKYKYLLHLNGNNGAYASRLKYLLACNSCVIYNCNSGQPMFWEEFWMYDRFFQPNKHYILCSNNEDVKCHINHANDDVSKTIAWQGFNFFKEALHYDNISLVWSKILNLYAKKCTFSIRKTYGVKFNNETK